MRKDYCTQAARAPMSCSNPRPLDALACFRFQQASATVVPFDSSRLPQRWSTHRLYSTTNTGPEYEFEV
ncbi:MAG: hypothetical protein DWQ08_01250 [Proteobacteria bacterium]|nr:MAG: hypothetical protein DWQ08_01250 [Pseudomonadota bacterium]